MPRAFTDRVLPLRLTPEPRTVERVLVGRSELITPEFANELKTGFRADGGERWNAHRFYLAYRALAERSGVVLPAIPPTLP